MIGRGFREHPTGFDETRRMNTSGIPADHLTYLRRRPFAFGCSTEILPADELEALSEYGNWLAALAAGLIHPVTAEQEHFVAVHRDEAEPSTLCERAWVRLKGRREYEWEEKVAPPPETKRDYGMVEFDADRCWW
jgi:uncharacterized protein YifE (UPF0438 family)